MSKNIDIRALIEQIVDLLDEKQGFDIVALDLKTSRRQVNFI